ncbi:MAG TPA: FHA domain-containing protein [Polyangiaceae bacterium]
MWKLVIEDDEGKRTVVPLTREQYSIGRKDGNTIRLTERNVSREHARLYKKANGVAATPAPSPDKPTFVLEDLTSYNGVFVNGLRITHAQDLAHGDLVQIGDYRIVLQDETLLDTAGTAATAADAKATMPQAPAARATAASLLDRPNRLVMLAGPTPGVEYPLTDERMTIGRAEDASISINHNSVSRLHCEVHALGDGRFEIVDKGSSNGVRVNASDLRRGIIEPGDVIELGDVKFKFIGAGQVFRATESQQLALLNDRAAADIIKGTKRGSNALPIAIFAVVVVAGAVGAWVYTRPKGEPSVAQTSSAASASPDQMALEDAKKKCGSSDCDGAHDELAALAESSPVRSLPDFRDVMNRWASQTLARGDAEQDGARKHALYQRVSAEIAVDPELRKTAANKLQALDAVAQIPTATPATLPSAATGLPPDAVTSTRPDAGRRTALAPEPNPPLPPPPPPTVAAAPPSPPPTPVVASPKPVGEDKERQAALQATTQDAKAALKSQLEQKVYSGRGTDMDIRLLIATCKELGDKMCVAQARQIQAQRGGGN